MYVPHLDDFERRTYEIGDEVVVELRLRVLASILKFVVVWSEFRDWKCALRSAERARPHSDEPCQIAEYWVARGILRCNMVALKLYDNL